MQPSSNLTAQHHNPLRADREGEHVVFQIKRHPIGLVFTYLSLLVMVVIIAILALSANSLLPELDNALINMVAMIALAVAVFFCIIFAVISHTVYYDNRWILTNDSLTQISRLGLFNRQSSQLGLDNLEDVTVQQAGILPHMFNYGVLRCQTAGEYGKFLFMYCPTPNEYAQKLLMARELFEHGPAHDKPEPTA